MGLPGEIRNRIFEYVLPVDINDRRDIVLGGKPALKRRRGWRIGLGNTTLAANPTSMPQWMYESNLKAELEERDLAAIGHPLLRTCRQIRYEYGALLCTLNTFVWKMPDTWDASLLTHFTQYAASVGVHDYDLNIEILGKVHDIDEWEGNDGHVDQLSEPERVRRANLLAWAKDAYDGIEIRLMLEGTSDLDNTVEVEVLVVKILNEAVFLRDSGRSWVSAERRLKKLMKANDR